MRKNISIIVIITLILLFSIINYSENIYCLESDITQYKQINAEIINQSPSPVRAGEIVEIQFGITNLGGVIAKDVVIQLEASYPFKEITGESLTKTIQSINPYQKNEYTQTISYKLLVDRDATDGTYEIKLNLLDSTNVSKIFSFNIEVIGKEYAQIITINKANIDFGKEEDLVFKITNTGSSPLRNLVFSWKDASSVILPVYSDNTKYIKYLDVGESRDVSYKVMANTNSDPGLYLLNLKLEFENNDFNANIIETTAGIFVGGKTDFDVTFAESESGKISLSIANIGNNPAYSVNISVPTQENYKTTGSNSSIIGNLDKGDYTVVTFQISSTSTSRSFSTTSTAVSNLQTTNNTRQRPSMQLQNTDQNNNFPKDQNSTVAKNNLKVNIEYTDSAGVRHLIEKSITLELNATATATTTLTTSRAVQSKNKINATNIIIIVVILILLIAGFVFYKIKTKKKAKIINAINTRKQ
ncbi:MAG: COG1361 S-layer family protein [archaeon]